jgi:hypothetical protein
VTIYSSRDNKPNAASASVPNRAQMTDTAIRLPLPWARASLGEVPAL